MQVLLDASKRNSTALRYFIQYEVLQKKPIWESYRAFCHTMGDDTMSYPEFEFWYWRVYNGEMDMDYDRSKDPQPLELMQLPLEIVEEVTKKLVPSSRVAVRNVCKPLRTVIDSGKMNMFGIFLDISEKPFIMDGYEHLGFKEEVKMPAQEQLNHIKSHLQQLLMNPRSQVDQFCIKFDPESKSPLPSLESSSHIKLNVRHLVIYSMNPVSFQKIFSLFQPGALEHIEFHNGGKSIQNFEELSDTEHYRQAKSIVIGAISTIDPNNQVHFLKEKFSHFSSFHISIATITVMDLIELKEHFQQLATFNKLGLTICSGPFYIIPFFDALAITLDTDVQEDEKVLAPIQGSNDFMEFSFERTCIQMERKRC